MESSSCIAVIGGTGQGHIVAFEKQKEIVVTTPLGRPSDRLIRRRLEITPSLFLNRHGRNYTLCSYPFDLPNNSDVQNVIPITTSDKHMIQKRK